MARPGHELLTSGYWSWVLVRRFGNPVFPLANGLFRSEFFAPLNFVRSRERGHAFSAVRGGPGLRTAFLDPGHPQNTRGYNADDSTRSG